MIAILSKGEFDLLPYHCSPVFFLLLTGAAKENFVGQERARLARSTGSTPVQRFCHANSETQRRRRSANFADRLSPIAYSYAP